MGLLLFGPSWVFHRECFFILKIVTQHCIANIQNIF
nr:MAG TPA: hypothetical protein [Caudoviricetes sp.]